MYNQSRNYQYPALFLIFSGMISTFFIFDITYYLYFYSVIVAVMTAFGVTALVELSRSNTKLFSLITFLCAVTSSQYVGWYYDRGYDILVIIGTVGFILIGFLCKNCDVGIDQNNSLKG